MDRARDKTYTVSKVVSLASTASQACKLHEIWPHTGETGREVIDVKEESDVWGERGSRVKKDRGRVWEKKTP
jgi:hypothetical protein